MATKKRGKSINLFLMDGTVTGRVKGSMANWTGVAYKIPRTMLEESRSREDLKQSGVYFLFGEDDETGENIVYIGQAGFRKNGEGVLNRLFEHKRDPKKDYWNEAIVFTTSNNSFGPTEISYLENRFCNIAVDAKRYQIKNDNDPTIGNVTEEKESELEEYIDYAKILMGALGHKVFEPYNIHDSSEDEDLVIDKIDDELILHLKRKDADATGKRTSEGFVIFRGSRITSEVTNSCPRSAIRRRKAFKDRGDVNEENIVVEDILMNSPSAAAAFVGGASLNGKDEWKTSAGLTLNDLEKQEK